MSLLAYSARRAVGALLVFLVVIWFIQFGVYHTIPLSPRHSQLDVVPDYYLQFQRLVHGWNVAALEVGIGVLVLLGLGALWRVRKRRTM